MWDRIRPTPATYTSGLFWNSIEQQVNVLKVIKHGFKYVGNFNRHSIDDVWNHLQSQRFLDRAYADDEALGKRILLSYRLRNETSHSYNPTDAGMITHADNLHLWLLQSIFYTYFWFTRTGQVTL